MAQREGDRSKPIESVRRKRIAKKIVSVGKKTKPFDNEGRKESVSTFMVSHSERLQNIQVPSDNGLVAKTQPLWS